MTTRRHGLALLALLASIAAAPARAQADELVVSGDGVVPVTVNGVPARIRIDPAVPALPMLTADYAARARLRPGPFAFGYMVGPEMVSGRSAVARIAVGAGARPRKRRVGWTGRAFAAGVDGVVGPGGLPQQIVRFVLGPSRPGERTVALPMADEGGLFGGWGHSYAVIDLGGAPLRVRFDPHHPRTLATAGAGVRLAAANDARIGGEVESEEIAFGISRPVRTLRLGTPLRVGPLTIERLGVRTADFGNAASIREEDGDPDEIIVTARRRDHRRDRIAIGADLLARCSALVFDKRAREIRLTCA
ncbi:MAG TPA: hypothetical protein VMS43_01955 [Allosphingosinicella sp.]|nr:hypothetical protein [Allosphingosinicella sp.]